MEETNKQYIKKQVTQQVRTQSWIAEHIQKVIIGLIVTTLFSMAGTIANLYISSRTATFAENDRAIQSSVEALEERIARLEPDTDRILILEENIKPMRQDILEIKQDIKSLLQKL